MKNKQTIYILTGLVGSGKSYWTTNFIKQPKNSQNTVIVNKDKLREMFHGRYKFKPEFEDFIHKMSVNLFKKAINYGYNVIVDETNITRSRREQWVDIVRKELLFNDIKIVYVWFTEQEKNLDNRMKDAKGASRKKWEFVIDGMKKRFEEPVEEELFDELIKVDYNDSEEDKTIIQDTSLPKALICDLDGTLAILNGRDPYNASTCYEDDINEVVRKIVNKFEDSNYTIIFCTGRPEEYREPTMKFLEKCVYAYKCDGSEELHLQPSFKLFMRKTDDTRKDSIIKEEIFMDNIKDNYYVEFVLDDRNQVVEGWRSLGLTCLQVAPGDF